MVVNRNVEAADRNGELPDLGDVLSLVAQMVDDIERNGRLPDALVSALTESGVHRLAVPRELGGIEAPVSDVMDLFESLAAVDGSTAWCSVIGAGSNLFAGYLPEATAREIFADPDQGNATMFAPTGRIASDGDRLAVLCPGLLEHLGKFHAAGAIRALSV